MLICAELCSGFVLWHMLRLCALAYAQALLRFRLCSGSGSAQVQALLRFRLCLCSGICSGSAQVQALLRFRLCSGSGSAQVQALLRFRLCSGSGSAQVQALLRFRLSKLSIASTHSSSFISDSSSNHQLFGIWLGEI